MLKISMVLAIVVSMGTASAGEGILTLPHKAVTLSNGLKVYMVKYPSPGVVAYELPVHAGSRNEVEKGKTGFAHFFEHLMFRGTKNMTSKQFGELYVRLGNENNAWTSNEMTDYHGVVASIYLPKILAAEADRFANLEFDEKALRDEAGAVLGEYNKDVAQPDFLLEEKMAATAFKVHPYGHTTMGYKEDVVKFTERYNDVWPFFRRYYRPSNVSVVLVGDIDFNKSLKDIEKEFGKWAEGKPEAPVEIPVEPEQTDSRSADVRLDKPTQTRLEVAFKVPAFSTKTTDSEALGLLAEMLFGVTSDFQKEFRFEKKWLDSVSAGGGETVDPGLWLVSLRLSEAGEGKEKELRAAVDKTLESVRAKEPSQERLDATKKRFKNAALTGWFASPEALAKNVSWYTNFEPDLGVLDRIFERLRDVEPKTLMAVARAHLTNNHKTTVTLHGAK
ncbi:MAG: insulinase family protein [Deltaproteobacteria bacterium]|nr:insulinase family protein [Deltaproteobacteria bacterium]